MWYAIVLLGTSCISLCMPASLCPVAARRCCLIKREFTVANEYLYNRSSATRWIMSHLLRYKHLAFGFMLLSIIVNVLFSPIPSLTGVAFTVVQWATAARSQLVQLALS